MTLQGQSEPPTKPLKLQHAAFQQRATSQVGCDLHGCAAVRLPRDSIAPRRQQLPAYHPQIGERKQRQHLRGVLGPATIADLDVTDTAATSCGRCLAGVRKSAQARWCLQARRAAELRHGAASRVANQRGYQRRQSLTGARVATDGINSGMDATNKSSWMDVQCRPGAGNVMRLHVADASVCRLIALHADMRPGLTVMKTALETHIANRKRHSATHIRQLHQQRRHRHSTATGRLRTPRTDRHQAQ